jgi:hypothetical protein
MVTDPERHSFWGELFTAPRIVSFVVMLTGGAMWAQAAYSEIGQLRRDVEAVRREYQRSDTLTLELTYIREEQRRMRQEQERQSVQQDDMAKQLAGIRRDLR